VIEGTSDRAPVHAGQPRRLRELGYDEIWLQNWLATDPGRLGLGEVTVLAQELTSPRGGSLDILAASADDDTYYSVEVQLGEVDASHGFRVFDYWALNRARYPGKRHVAVLMAESAGGRYRQALEALAEYLPLIVIELRIWLGAGEAIIVPETAIANESLDVAGTAGPAGGTARAEADWREEATEEAWRFVEQFVAWTETNLGEVRVDYAPQSYIGVRRGRRVWAPLWLRTDGATIYLPDPDGSRSETPSLAFDYFSDCLREVGLDAGWQRTYNAGSNPISLRLRRPDLAKEPVRELLRASFEILDADATPFTQRHPVTTVGPEGDERLDLAEPDEADHRDR
jgi:hypothetical protein